MADADAKDMLESIFSAQRKLNNETLLKATGRDEYPQSAVLTDLNSVLTYPWYEDVRDKPFTALCGMGWTSHLKQAWIQQYLTALQAEVGELQDSVAFKFWRPHEVQVTPEKEQNVRVELVDILHFWVSLCQLAGMTAEDVYEAYCKKNQINYERQDSGYHTKEDDCKDI